MKKIKTALLILLLPLAYNVAGQSNPAINIVYSKLLATYDFVQKLSDNYPDNKYKQLFESSSFHTRQYIDLVKQADTLHIYESYRFQGYPTGQKRPVMTTSLIERNLIHATTPHEFKENTFGIIPNAELFALSTILSEFIPVYDSLVYDPHKKDFEEQLKQLRQYVGTSDLAGLFKKGLIFYGSQWDHSIPTDIAVIPTISSSGFTANAFLNNAISEIPLHYKHNDILFSVLMHEIYHNLYDGQSLQLQLQIESWFKNNRSKYSQYAYLLLNEVLATALGNGYVYEQLNGKTDKSDWYNVKYIDQMAKQIYPVVKEYLFRNKRIDSGFVDKYIAAYDKNFSGWVNELDHLFTNRYVLSDHREDLDYFGKNYRYSSMYQSEIPITQSALERMKETPITKVIIISSDHNEKLQMVKNTFSELKNWKYDARKEVAYAMDLKDKTKLIIVNKHSTTLDQLFEKYFINRRIN